MDFDEISRRVHAYARAHHGAAIAADLAQEALAMFLVKQDRLNADEPLAILFTMVDHLAIDRYRRRRHEEDLWRNAISTGRGVWPSAPHIDMFREAELREGMRGAFHDLTPLNRTIASLHLFVGMSWREIGAAVGLTRRAAEARWRRTICPCLQRFLRDWVPALLAVLSSATGLLRSVRDRIAGSTSAVTMTCGLVVGGIIVHEIELPLYRQHPPPQSLEESPAGPAAEVVAPSAGRAKRDPVEPVPGREADRHPGVVTEPPAPPPDTNPPEPSARTSLELTPNPNDADTQQRDSTEVDTPQGTVLFGGEIYTTGPIVPPLCPVDTEKCPVTARAEHGSG